MVVCVREDSKARDVRGVGMFLREWEVNFFVSACKRNDTAQTRAIINIVLNAI